MQISPFAFMDTRRWRFDMAYYTELRETFDDPLPLPDYAPVHPLMIHNHIPANRARQAAVLAAIDRYQQDEKERGHRMASEFAAAQQPPTKPNVPGTPTFNPNLPPTSPAPGTPGYRPPTSPSPPATPPPTSPSTTEEPPEPAVKPEVFRDEP